MYHSLIIRGIRQFVMYGMSALYQVHRGTSLCRIVIRAVAAAGSLQIQPSGHISLSAELSILVRAPRVQFALRCQSRRVPFPARDLPDLFLDVGHFDRQTLSQEVSVPQLAQLSPAPSKHFPCLTQRHSVTLPAGDVYNLDARQGADHSHAVLARDAAVTQLAIDAAAPGKDHALVVNGGCVVETQRQLQDGGVGTQGRQEKGTGLLFAGRTETTELA